MNHKKYPPKKHKNGNKVIEHTGKSRERTKKMTALLLDEKVLQALRGFCDRTEWTMSGFIEEAVIEMMDLDIKPTRRAKLTLQDRKEILLLHCDGYKQAEIARMKGVTPMTVHRTIQLFKRRET